VHQRDNEGRFSQAHGRLPVLASLRALGVYENEFVSVMTFDEEHHRLGIVKLPPPAQRNSPTDV
jgi:hypothetical protein